MLGIGFDVSADAGQGLIVADNVFVIISLPDGCFWHVAQGIDAF